MQHRSAKMTYGGKKNLYRIIISEKVEFLGERGRPLASKGERGLVEHNVPRDGDMICGKVGTRFVAKGSVVWSNTTCRDMIGRIAKEHAKGGARG
jgi:hypothetical protein